MRLPRTLSAYLVREIAAYTALGLAAISAVLVSRNLLRFLEDLVGAGFAFGDLATLVRCLIAMLAAYALPVAFLFGVLLAVGRLSADREITAMRSCGLGLTEIVLPTLALGITVSCVTWYLVLEVEHRAYRELKATARSMALRATAIEPGRFRRIGARVIYARDVDTTGQLHGVMISDRSDPERPLLIFAEYGQLSWEEEGGVLHFRLQNGDVHVDTDDDRSDQYQRLTFVSSDYSFGIAQLMGRNASQIRPREMSTSQLRAVLDRARAGDPLDDLREKNPADYSLQIHRRVALPVAPALFALVGVPLGLRSRRGARSLGALWCAALAFAYYALLVASQRLALRGALPAGWALWIPNAVFALAAAWLLLRARRSEV